MTALGEDHFVPLLESKKIVGGRHLIVRFKLNRVRFRFALAAICVLLLTEIKSQKINEDSLVRITQDITSSTTALIQAHNRLSRYYLSNDTTKALSHLYSLDSIATISKDTVAKIMTGDLYMRYHVNNSQYDKGESYARENLRLSQAIGRIEFVANSYNALGVVKSLKNEYDSVLFYLDTSYRIKLSTPTLDPVRLSKTINNLAATAIRFNKYEKGLAYFQESLELAKDSKNEQIISIVYNGIGTVYEKLNELELSREYLQRSLQYARSISDHFQIGHALHNIGGTHKLAQPDSAIHYYQQALISFKKIGIKERIGLSTMAIGDALVNKGQANEALEYYKEAYQNYIATGNLNRIVDAKSRLAKGYYELGKSQQADEYMNEVVAYYEQQEDLESLTKALNLKSNILEQTGDFKNALTYQIRYQKHSDSLNHIKFNKDVAEMTTRFETQKKEAEISKQQLIISEQKSYNRTLLISSFLGGSLLLSIIVGLFQRSKKNKEINKQKVQLQTQKIAQLEKEKKILSMNALMEGQELERTRIAQDLHDGLGGLLSTVKAHFSNIQSEIQKIEKINVYNRANELVDEACDEVRRISHNLMPGALRLEGLKTAVLHLGEEMNAAHPFQIQVESFGFETRMDESQEVFVYRIIQEALNNIIKHAAANNVLIQMSETTSEYHFIVEDDGKGFDPLGIESGLGLKSIQSRVDFLKGSLDVDTKEGIGTTLTWHIPK